tara:strand:+ start:16938 stop:17111 length:174 start_codon:yes stop_codon:yes gene_type:complete
MRKRIEKGISIKPEKGEDRSPKIYMTLDQFKKCDEAYKKGYMEYVGQLKKGHPMAKP